MHETTLVGRPIASIAPSRRIASINLSIADSPTVTPRASSASPRASFRGDLDVAFDAADRRNRSTARALRFRSLARDAARASGHRSEPARFNNRSLIARRDRPSDVVERRRAVALAQAHRARTRYRRRARARRAANARSRVAGVRRKGASAARESVGERRRRSGRRKDGRFARHRRRRA